MCDIFALHNTIYNIFVIRNLFTSFIVISFIRIICISWFIVIVKLNIQFKMGVTGLWKLIEQSGKPVPVETLENKILAVGKIEI